MNAAKTGILLIVMTAILVLLGNAVGGPQGAAIAFGLALLMNGFAYWFSDRMVLRMYRAKEVTEADSPTLYAVVADLAQRAQLPMPRVYVMPGPSLNAFATGRNPKHAAVAVTEGPFQGRMAGHSRAASRRSGARLRARSRTAGRGGVCISTKGRRMAGGADDRTA